MVKNLVVDYIFERYGDLLDSYEAWLFQDRLKVFADAVRNKGAALDNCWGFVDGTVMSICKPNQQQRAFYNGHKRVHVLKFKSVVAPNGLIATRFEPVEGGRYHTCYVWTLGIVGAALFHTRWPTSVYP